MSRTPCAQFRLAGSQIRCQGKIFPPFFTTISDLHKYRDTRQKSGENRFSEVDGGA